MLGGHKEKGNLKCTHFLYQCNKFKKRKEKALGVDAGYWLSAAAGLCDFSHRRHYLAFTEASTAPSASQSLI